MDTVSEISLFNILGGTKQRRQMKWMIMEFHTYATVYDFGPLNILRIVFHNSWFLKEFGCCLAKRIIAMDFLELLHQLNELLYFQYSSSLLLFIVSPPSDGLDFEICLNCLFFNIYHLALKLKNKRLQHCRFPSCLQPQY